MIHLKRAGVPQKDMVMLYKCFLVSLLDYAAVVYHPMLTGGQTEELEKLQSTALKIIFSYEDSYATLLEKSRLDSLEVRRLALLDKFIIKTARNPSFGEEWFPKKTFSHHNLRQELYYEEKYARTNRLYNSLIFFYRLRLNEIDQHDLNKQKKDMSTH